MRKWAHDNLPRGPLRILECGSGNGTLLLSFLTSPSSEAQKFSLTGIDYSPLAADLAAGVEKTRREQISNGDYPDDSDSDHSEDESRGVVVNSVPPVEWRCGDLLRDEIAEKWDLVLDKGTFDALCLSDEPVQEAEGRPPSLVYPERIARLVQKGGFFLITSCNFTEEEVKRRWTKPGLGESRSYVMSKDSG
jgi:SAM-dependent methyltransferase